MASSFLNAHVAEIDCRFDVAWSSESGNRTGLAASGMAFSLARMVPALSVPSIAGA
jgi:hypothetical protein